MTVPVGSLSSQMWLLIENYMRVVTLKLLHSLLKIFDSRQFNSCFIDLSLVKDFPHYTNIVKTL